jgi:hypothetical protein
VSTRTNARGVDPRFEEEQRVLLHERLATAAVVGACVYPAFIIQDYRLVQARWQQMLVLRLISSLLCLLALAISKTEPGRRYPFALTWVAVGALAVLKTFITPLEVTGVGSLYFGGHVLILVAAMSFLPLSTGQAVVLSLTTHLGYSVPMLVFGHPIDAIAFSTQNSLLVAMWMLLCVGCHLNHGMRQREFQLRHKLYAARHRALDYG